MVHEALHSVDLVTSMQDFNILFPFLHVYLIFFFLFEGEFLRSGGIVASRGPLMQC